MSDFTLCTHTWKSSRKLFDAQIAKLQHMHTQHHPDAIVVMSIPRHHAKKFTHSCDWTKDYFVSKETRAVTDSHTLANSAHPTPITLVLTRSPTTSEQWFAFDVEPVAATGAGEVAQQPFAHVVEVCIGLNAWHPQRCPLVLLQEYQHQLSYDEVSTITLVVTTHVNDDLRKSFDYEVVRNSVVFIAPDEKIETQLFCWKVLQEVPGESKTMMLASTLGEDEDGGDGIAERSTESFGDNDDDYAEDEQLRQQHAKYFLSKATSN